MPEVKPKIDFHDYARFLTRYLRPHLPMVLLLGVLLFISIGLQLTNPLILRKFIDGAQAGGDPAWLTRLALAFIFIAVCQQLLGVLVTYITERLGWATTNQVRLELARHTLGLDMSFHAGHTPGEMIERIDGDVMALSNFFSQFILQVLGNILLVSGILVVLFLEDWRVGAVMLTFVVVTITLLLKLANIAVPAWEMERQASANMFGFLEERLSGTEDIRSNNAMGYVLDKFYRLTRDLMRKTITAGLRLNILLNTTWVLFAVSNAIALLISAALYQTGEISLGTVYMNLYYTNMLNWPLERITQQMQDLQRAGASLVRIMQIQNIQSRIAGEGDYRTGDSRLPAGALAIEFSDITFSYHDSQSSAEKVTAVKDPAPGSDGKASGGEVVTETGQEVEKDRVLRDVSFHLQAGRTLGLLGRTGSGKTTLTRLLFRLYDPDQGQILLGKETSGLVDIRHLPLRDLRHAVGMVTQNIQLFHATLRENLTFFNEDIHDEAILEAIRDLGLWDWYAALPKGLDTELESGGGGLSAGEAQLLAFTRIFLRNPGLVILDEATSRLDPATENLIERAVDKLVHERTAIIVAHRLGTVQRADDILILENGQIGEYGARAGLASDPDSRFYHLLQTGLEEVMV